MQRQLALVKESVAFLENKAEIQPQIGIVLERTDSRVPLRIVSGDSK